MVSDRVPTLTEVVDLAGPADLPGAAVGPQPCPELSPSTAPLELSAEVLFELEQRIDSLFEMRLREALAPALARAADGLIREARLELSSALRDLVEDAVVRALERRTHL